MFQSRSFFAAFVCFFFAALTLMSSPPIVHGAPIISDTFSRVGNLQGSSPDIDTTSGAHTWSVAQNLSSNITTDGSVMQVPGTGSPYAVLPFALSDVPAGAVVTLGADLTITDAASSAQWIALGFTAGGPANGGSPWVLLTAGGGIAAFVGPGANTTFVSIASGSGTSAAANLALSYDTASNTVTLFANGTPLGSHTYASAPTISAVSISTSATTTLAATVDNFIVAVPEPASASLLLAAGSMLLGIRRR
jgi:hypothetical protein